MNNENDNQSSSINTKLSVCFSILIISIIILIFCDKDTICFLYTYVYTFIFVSISYLFLEYRNSIKLNKSGGFVEKLELFKYTRDDIENEKQKLETQNISIAKIMDIYDGFERYNDIKPISRVANIENNTNIIKGLNSLNAKELEEEAADLLKTTRTDFIPIGLKRILLSKINNRLSFSDGVIKRIIESNKWAPDAKMFNQNFINIVKQAYLDSKKGLSYINGRNISERLLNEEYLLKPNFSSELKTNINMLERDKILNDDVLSQCGKLLYSMLAHNQIINPELACTDYYFSGQLMSESDDESLEKNILLHSQLVDFFENIIIENIDKVDSPTVSAIKCNLEKTGSAEKYGGAKLTVQESNELAVLSGKVRYGLKPKEKERMDQLLNKQKNSNIISKKPVAVKSTENSSLIADSKTPISTKTDIAKKTSKYNNLPVYKNEDSNPIVRSEAKIISTSDSIKKEDNISEDEFKNGMVSNDRILLEDKITSKNEGRSILSKFAETIDDQKNGVNVFSRNLILRRPAVLLLNRTYLGDKTNPFDGELQAKNYNEFRDRLYKIFMYNINDLHLRFMAHFISNKKRLSELTSIDDKCLERINKIGEKIKTLEEEVEIGKTIKEELETLKFIEKEANELRGNKYELEAQLKQALEGKGSWKTTQELDQKTEELRIALAEKQKIEEEMKALYSKNSGLIVSTSDLKSEASRLQTKVNNLSEEKDLLIKENNSKYTEITKLKDKIEDLNYSLKYLSERENRIIAETKFSDKILKDINSGRSEVRKVISIVEKLKNVVVDKYKSRSAKLSVLNIKISGTVNKLQNSLAGINMLAERTSIINSFYSKDKLKKSEKENENIQIYKKQISNLNIQMRKIQDLLKPFFITNGTGFEYLKQHLENLNNEKSLIQEELSKINFDVLSRNIKFADFIGEYNNELNIKDRIKSFSRLSDIDTELYYQYKIVERYNQFVDNVFKEFKKVEPVNNEFLFTNREFLKEYEFLALNYRNYILKHNRVVELNTTLLSKNNILSKRLNELSLENKLLSNTISSKEPDTLIITMKDEIVRLNSEIDKYYKNNSSCVQDLEELKQNLNQSMTENSDLKDTILNLEKEINSLKEDYRKQLESVTDKYTTELNNDLDTMVILLNGSNNIDWNTNNIDISNTRKKQLFIISKIKELLLSNDNGKKINFELEQMKKTIKSLNEEAERKNIIISELREAISTGKEFIDSSGIMSSSNLFKTNSELYEEEKLKMQENIKMIENDKKKILEELDYLQAFVEKSNEKYGELKKDIANKTKSIAKASDYMATPLGFHTKNALDELFKCISPNSIKRILFHKMFKEFFTKSFVREFNMQSDLTLNTEGIEDINIFTENALNEIYNYTTDDNGEETNIYTDNFSKYLKKMYDSKIEENEIEFNELKDKKGKVEYVDDDDGNTLEYMDDSIEPDEWDFDSKDEYKKAVELFRQKKLNTVKNETETVEIKTNDVDDDDMKGMDGKLIIMLILEKLNVVNKESEYYKNVILPLFNKYQIYKNSFNDNKFVKKCFNSIDNDTDNYINKIRKLDSSYTRISKSIIETNDHDIKKTNLLLSLERYIYENMDEKDMIYNLYSLDKYENSEMDYLLAVIILDIKNYESISKFVKNINSKIINVESILKHINRKLISSVNYSFDRILSKTNNLNKNYYFIFNSIKNLIFKDNDSADSFIETELDQISKRKGFNINRFNEIQAIIITKLREHFFKLKDKVKELERELSAREKVNSNFYNTKGLLQTYENRVLEISNRLQLYSSNVKEITTSISDDITKIKSNKEKLNKANNQILKLNKFNEELEQQLTKLTDKEQINLAEINSLNESLEKINNAINYNKTNKSIAESSISSLDKNINSINLKLKEYDNQILQLDGKVNELSSVEIGRNKINREIKQFIIEITPDISDKTVIQRLKLIKQKLDDNFNTIKEKEDEKNVLTELNNGLTADRDRIISDINNLLNESITSDDKQWMNDMDTIGIKLDIINKFIEKWENNGNEKIRSLIESLQKNKQISANLLTKLNTDISDISDIDFIIQKIKPHIKKPEELAVKYDSDLIKYRDKLEETISQKNKLEKEVSQYVLDRRNKILLINDLDTKLREYINNNNSLTIYIDNISSKYNKTIQEKEELAIDLKNIKDEINSKNLEVVRLSEEIQKQKDTIFEMSKTIETMESSSKSKIDKEQCSKYIESVVDSIIEIMSDKVSSIKEITKIAEFISNRWNSGNLDIAKYIQKNKLLEEEIKRLSNVNIEYEKNITEFKTLEDRLKNLTMILNLFINKSDKTILNKLKLTDLKEFNNSQELEKYLNAKIDLSSEIIKGFSSVVDNYESIKNILKDKELSNNIAAIISKCNEYKKILDSKNIKAIENVNEILLSKEELEVKIQDLENQLNLLIVEKNNQIKELKDQIKDDKYVDTELSKITGNKNNGVYTEDIEYVQTIMSQLESIILKENVNNDVDIFKSNLDRMLNLSAIYLNKENQDNFSILYNNLSKTNIVELNPLIKNILRNIIKKASDENYELNKKEIMSNVSKYNKNINDEITKVDSKFKIDILLISEKLDRYKLLFLKASNGIKKYTEDINKSSEIIADVKDKISAINLELYINKKQLNKILEEKQKAIDLNKKLKEVQTITVDTANVLQSNIDSYNKDIIKIQIYLRTIVDYTKKLKEDHAKIIDNLLLSKDKSDVEKQEAIDKYNKSLEDIETTSKALKECNYLDKQYKIERDISINQLQTDLIEAKKLLDVSLIDLDKFSGVVKKSINYIYGSIQEINIISDMTEKLSENINKKLTIKEDAVIVSNAIKNKEIYDKIIKDFKSPIEKQIFTNKLLAIELNFIKNNIDIISKKYKNSIITKCKKEADSELRIVDEIIYVDRNNNIIMPSVVVDKNNNIINAKKVKEPITDYDKYRKQLVKQ